MPLRRALSYDRVSGQAQAKRGKGLDRQEMDAAAWAAANGYELDEELRFRDAGKSASKGHHIAEGGALRRLLDMAQSGEIEPGTTLVVEAIDRLTRLEPVDALLDIVGPLVRAGIRIATIEDGAIYDRERLREDSSALLVLTIKCQAAAEFSARLARRQRSRWAQDREALRAGRIVRPELFRCAWLDWDPGQQGYVLNSYADTARLALQMLRDFGLLGAARELNARGLLSPSGRKWTGAAVNQLLHNPSIEGTLTLNKERRGKKARQQMADDGLVEERFPGMLPPLVSAEEAATLRAIVAGRSNNNAPKGPTGATLFVGQGLAWCTCGARVGVTTSSGQRKRHHYVRCRHRFSNKDGCRGHAFRLRTLQASLLTRLHAGELKQLLAVDHDRSAAAAAEQQAVTDLTGRLALAQQEQGRAESAWKAAVLAGDDTALVTDLRDLLGEARLRAEEIEGALSSARARLAALGQELSTGEVDAGVAAMLQAFADGEDTPEMRRTVQLGLKRLGVRIELDPQRVAMGISVAGGPLRWQPVDDTMAMVALARGTTSAIYRDLTITDRSIPALAALYPDDPGWAAWLESMKGVRQVNVASLPPNSELAAAAKAFYKTITEESPELAEALRAMNGIEGP